MLRQRPEWDRAGRDPSYRMKLVRSASDLERWRAAWHSLEARATLPTQSFAWTLASAASFQAEGGLYVAGEEDGGNLDAVAPLAMRGRGPRRRLEALSVAELSEPADILCANADALDCLVRELARTRVPLVLDRVPADTPTVEAVRSAWGLRGVVLCRPQEDSPFIRLDDAWREPAAKLSSRRRSDLRRARRRAEQIGAVELEVHTPTEGNLEGLLATAWAVEARSWRAERHGALAQDPLRGPFFRTLARLACREGMLRIALLRAGETTIAMQLALVFARSIWLLKVGFDEEYGRCSPGMLLTAETIRYAAEVGLDKYEFLGVVEPWTQVWTDVVRPYVSLRAYPPSFRGAMVFLGDAAAAARRRLRRAVQ